MEEEKIIIEEEVITNEILENMNEEELECEIIENVGDKDE